MDEKKQENEYLKRLLTVEDLGEKKANIYARLLIDTALAKKMEELARSHQEKKQRLERLLFGEERKKSKEENER